MHFFYIAMSFFIGIAAAAAQSVEGQFAYPPVGTELTTSETVYRVVSVKGFDAVFLNTRTGRSEGVHAHVMSGATVGADLKYRKSIPERLWPLEVGKRVNSDSNRDSAVRGYRIEVVQNRDDHGPGRNVLYLRHRNERTRGEPGRPLRAPS